MAPLLHDTCVEFNTILIVVRPSCRVVTIGFNKCSYDSLLPAFADCLACLPNTHTLRIVYAPKETSKALQHVFEEKVYPQICKVALPSDAHQILRCCPNVTEVVNNGSDNGKRLVNTIAYACKHVEVLRGFSLDDNSSKMAKRAYPDK